MYYRDHEPPHFHALYGEHQAQVVIATLDLLNGELAARALRLVREWAALQRTELEANWEKARAREVLVTISTTTMSTENCTDHLCRTAPGLRPEAPLRGRHRTRGRSRIGPLWSSLRAAPGGPRSFPPGPRRRRTWHDRLAERRRHGPRRFSTAITSLSRRLLPRARHAEPHAHSSHGAGVRIARDGSSTATPGAGAGGRARTAPPLASATSVPPR